MASDTGEQETPVKVFVEVTDTLSITYTTGIQRVVRELIAGLRGPLGSGLEIIPIVKPSEVSDYRTLTAEEDSRLRDHPPGGRAGRRADNFGRLSPAVRVLGDLRPVIAARVAAGKLLRKRRERHPRNAQLAIGRFPNGSIFLDIEGSWFDPEPRSKLLPRLARQGIRSVVLIHDVMPVIHPEWFDPRQITVFDSWLDAHLRHSDAFLANSKCTADDLIEITQKRVNGRIIEPTVIPLGADYARADPRPVELTTSIGRFLLVVGTLEPRKNQRIVLDAFDRLRGRYDDLGLVLVGKEGWMVDEVVSRIRSHEEFERRLLWLGGIDDSELSWLYQNAFLSIAPSKYEGLGVPVIEALSHGCPTIASSGGAQREAGQGFTELIEPDDSNGLTELIQLHLTDQAHHDRQRDLANSYRPPSWADTTEVVASAIRAAALSSR